MAKINKSLQIRKKSNKCKVRINWFSKLDSHHKPYGKWLQTVPDSMTKVLCTVCNIQLNCEFKGFQAISQHENSSKHKKLHAIVQHESQLHFKPATYTELAKDAGADILADSATGSSIDLVNARQPLQLVDYRDEATKAEIIWTLKVVASNYSLDSCDDISQTFKAMFPTHQPCSQFSMGKFKLAYMITDCVGPYFRTSFLNDIGDSYYTLCFDETTNAASKKELHTSVRYYSENSKRIVQHHLETFFIENGKAETIVKYLIQSLDNAGLSIERMISLSMDGPNVNKKVFRLMNEKYFRKTGRNLINIGSCNLHIVHNGFKQGLDEFGSDVESLLVNVYYYFDGEALRCQEYLDIQTKLKINPHKFIKHVSSRWLTIQDSAKRMIEQWDGVLEYFLKFVPKHRPKTMDSIKYKTIIKHLKSGTMLAELYFVKESAELLQLFLKYMQVEEPLIHKMQELLSEVLLKILGRIAKPKSFAGATMITIESFDSKNLLPITDINLSADITNALRSCKDVDKAQFRLNVRKHYKAIASHMLMKTSYNNSAVQCLKYISPTHILDDESSDNIVKFSRLLPFTSSSTLIDEWTLLKVTIHSKETSKYEGRIDDYWQQHFNAKGVDNAPRFPSISKIIKCGLSLSHGSADVERALSSSGLTLTDDKTQMTIRTLNARLNIKSGLKCFHTSPITVPIDKQFIESARRAHQHYKMYMADCKRKEEELRQKDIEKENEQIRIKQADAEFLKKKEEIQVIEKLVQEKEKEASSNAKQLLSEANDRLKEAIRKKNLEEASLAQGMIEGAKVLIEKETEVNNEILKLKSKLAKKKTEIIEKYVKKS